MLVLSRKVSESLLIGQDIRITVLKVERSHVRIGIEAPGTVTILRAELAELGMEAGDDDLKSRLKAGTVAAG
jgi:carbon storage regulator